MSDLSIIPLEDGFETQLAQDWNGATGTVYVLDTPSYTPTTTNTYIVVNPGKTNMQIAEITDYDSTANTLTVSNVTLLKGLGINSTAPASSHATGSKVIISDNYQFWADIQTAINSKLDKNGNNGVTYATTAARDSALGADGVATLPYRSIYVTATGLFYNYNLSANAWQSIDTGTSPANATTSVAGLVRSDVAPAGIPVALIQDNPKYDALAGTSGTPSTSNKYVTNDDTATAATADKVARRLAGGNITVVTEAAGTSDTNAASTAFVQQEIAAGPNFANIPNVGVTPTTYFTHSMRVDVDLGWTMTGTPTLKGNWQSMAGATNISVNILLGGRATGANAHISALQWDSGVDFKMAYLHTTHTLSTGTTPAGAGDVWYFHGFTTTAEATSGAADITGVTARVGFAHYNGRIYTITGSGAAVTATDIQADAATTKRHFMIDFTPTSVKFYINGVLVRNETATIPTGSTDIYANFGGYDGSGTATGDFGMSADIIFSETII